MEAAGEGMWACLCECRGYVQQEGADGLRQQPGFRSVSKHDVVQHFAEGIRDFPDRNIVYCLSNSNLKVQAPLRSHHGCPCMRRQELKTLLNVIFGPTAPYYSTQGVLFYTAAQQLTIISCCLNGLLKTKL